MIIWAHWSLLIKKILNSNKCTDFDSQNSFFQNKNIYFSSISTYLFFFNERLSHCKQKFLSRILKFDEEFAEKNVWTLKSIIDCSSFPNTTHRKIFRKRLLCVYGKKDYSVCMKFVDYTQKNLFGILLIQTKFGFELQSKLGFNLKDLNLTRFRKIFLYVVRNHVKQ